VFAVQLNTELANQKVEMHSCYGNHNDVILEQNPDSGLKVSAGAGFTFRPRRLMQGKVIKSETILP
jgi:hypothetical protein